MERNNNIDNLCNKIIRCGLLSFCFFSPLSVSGAEASLGITVLAWLIKTIIAKKNWIKTPLDIPILSFIILIGISSAFSQNPLDCFSKMTSLWVILLYFVVTNNNLKEGDFRRLLKILIFMTFLVSLYGLWAHLTGRDFIHPGRNSERISGTFSIPLTFAEYLIVILSLIFSLVFSEITKKEKILFGIMGLVIILAFIYTYTRSSWLGMISALFFIGWMKKKKIFAITLGSIALISLLFIIFDVSIRERVMSIFSISSNINRIIIWRAALEMIKDYPLLGVGIDNWSRFCTSYGVTKGISTSHAHNNLLHIAATSGIWTSLVFLWIWLTFFIFGLKGYLKMKEGYSKTVILGSIGGMIGLNISGFFENNFTDSEVALLMWFTIGMVITLLKSK